MRHTIGQPELLKEINRTRLYACLKQERVISRAALASATGLSRATTGIIADELIQAGIARELGPGDSTGGRPPLLLEFDPDAAYTIGALLYDRKWQIVLTNLDARVLHRLELDLADDSPQTAVAALKDGVDQIIQRVDARRVLPVIGLGTPGLVDMETGVIQSAVDVGWSEVPFQALAEEALGFKTLVANRSKVGVLGELWHAPDESLKHVIFISIGTGIAAGIAHDGVLFTGANSSAGEVGHMTILLDGPLCPCGNHGCLQQLASAPAIANLARQYLRQKPESMLQELASNRPELLTAQMVFHAAERGDELALDVVKKVAGFLGVAVANLINLFNPEWIILGGPVGFAAAVMLEPLRAEVRRRAMFHPLSVAHITTSSLGPDAGAIGAAVLVLQRSCELIFARQALPASEI